MNANESYEDEGKRLRREREEKATHDDLSDRLHVAHLRAKGAERCAEEAEHRAATIGQEHKLMLEGMADALEAMTAALTEEVSKRRRATVSLGIAVECIRWFVALHTTGLVRVYTVERADLMGQAVRQAVELLHSIDGTQPKT